MQNQMRQQEYWRQVREEAEWRVWKEERDFEADVKAEMDKIRAEKKSNFCVVGRPGGTYIDGGAGGSITLTPGHGGTPFIGKPQ